MKSTMNKLVRHVRTAFTAMRGSPPGALFAALCGCLMLVPLVTAQVRNPIDTIAGSGRTAAFGDGGPALSASLAVPQGVAVDSLGNVYIAEVTNHRVRRIDAASGTISTVAGTGEYGSSGDDGPATSAQLWLPWGVAVDSLDNLYIADYGNHRVRRIDAASGTHHYGRREQVRLFWRWRAPASSAKLNSPRAVAVDSLDNLYIADYGNRRVRRIDAALRHHHHGRRDWRARLLWR